MTVKDVLIIACGLLDEKDLSSYIASENATIDSEKEKKKNCLIDCYNLVLGELAEGVISLTHTETLTSSNEKILYSAFLYQPLRILACEQNGIEVDYKVKNTYMEVKNGQFEVTYSYIPPIAILNSEYAFSDKQLSARSISYGIAAEYLLIKGLFEEAVIMRDRFEKIVTKTTLPKSCRKIKQRSWF